MFESDDIIDLIRLFDKHNVRFMLIGGYAVIHYTEPRYTKDVDFLVQADEANAQCIIEALAEFGLSRESLRVELFAEEGQFFKFGRPPWRVDLITSVAGLEFDEIYRRCRNLTFDKFSLKVVSLKDLMQLKELAGREQDRIDLKLLRKAQSL